MNSAGCREMGGENQGEARGIAIGEAQGERKKAREIALALSKKGMPAPSIAETVQVDLEVVEQWLSETETAKP